MHTFTGESILITNTHYYLHRPVKAVLEIWLWHGSGSDWDMNPKLYLHLYIMLSAQIKFIALKYTASDRPLPGSFTSNESLLFMG